jgi:4-hydroxy-2-oxoheptanedioate aldolase
MTSSAIHPAAALVSRIAAGPPALAAWCGLPDAAVPEALVRAGFDCAVLDMQHGSFDVALMLAAVANVALAGKASIVRIAVDDFATASRALDAGAAGVIAPMINSVGDAKRFAEFMKFPPLGGRSWGPHRALSLTGLAPVDYFHQANSFSLALAMIETREALAALDDILAVPGIDGVFVGPNDLSIALTHGATVDQFHPDVDKALDHIAARAMAHGKFASAFCIDGKRAREVGAKGYRLMSVSTDGLLLKLAAQMELGTARG